MKNITADIYLTDGSVIEGQEFLDIDEEALVEKMRNKSKLVIYSKEGVPLKIVDFGRIVIVDILRVQR